jgi:hypothetical protein
MFNEIQLKLIYTSGSKMYVLLSTFSRKDW